MLVINFSHPLTRQQVFQIEQLTGKSIDKVLDIPSQVDPGQALEPQVTAMIASTGITSVEWQTQPLIINLPPLNYSTAMLLAKLHGLRGHFPAVLRLRPVTDSVVHKYEVAEIINLQQVRDCARQQR